MNEELKILITAVTAEANKNLQSVQKELKGVKESGEKSGSAMAAFGKYVKGAIIAVGAFVAAATALVAALVKIGDSTSKYIKSIGQLTSAYQAAGLSAQQAQKNYEGIFRFLGETDKAVEAANLMVKLTQNEKELAEWTRILQGIYATFPDSLPIESLIESANETAKVGKVTGTLADALNWAGVSEDEFNNKLAATNAEAEREVLIRQTLNQLYKNAADLYEKNNAQLIKQNEAQSRLNNTLASIGKIVIPLKTALTELANAFLKLLGPAIEAITPYLVAFMNAIAKALTWVNAFISALTGRKQTVTVTEQIATGMNSAANGAAALTQGLESAASAAEKVKRATTGFDELNIVSTQTAASSSGGGAAGGSSGSSGSIGGGELISIETNMSDAFAEAGKSAEKFANKIKDIFEGIKSKVSEWAQLFKPAAEAWSSAFEGTGETFANAFSSMGDTIVRFKDNTLAPVWEYIINDFIPTIANNFSENFAPIFSETATWAVTQFAEDFGWMAEQVETITNDTLIPTMEGIKEVTTDTADTIGDEWEENGTEILDKTGGFIDSLKTIWENFYNNVISPIWENIKTSVGELWDNNLKPLWDNIVSFISSLIQFLLTLWNNVLAPIINWLTTTLAPVVVNIVNRLWNILVGLTGYISDIISSWLKMLGGLLDFLTGVFSGNWQKAWDGIKKFFEGIWNYLWTICRGVVNSIISGINSLWSGIYSVVASLVNGIGSIAGAIGNMLGKDWNFKMPGKAPQIPLLATGGIVSSATVAMIGERGKEAVLPLENNTEWMDILADKLASRNNTPSKLYMIVDKKVLGEMTINSFNDILKTTGNIPISVF